MGRRAGEEPVGRLALDDAARAAARAADGRAHVRPARHADRLRDHGACATSCSTIRPISCCRASTTAPTSPRTSPTRAPSPPPSKARMLGIRSIAMSQVGGSLEEGKIHWETPLTHGPGLLARLLDAGWPKDIVININYPPCPPDAVTGIEVTRQGRRDQASLAHRPAQRPVGHAVLLVQLRASAVDDGAGHRSCRHRRAAHFGDAAVPRTSRTMRPAGRCARRSIRSPTASARRAATSSELSPSVHPAFSHSPSRRRGVDAATSLTKHNGCVACRLHAGREMRS